ncbi:hypothetical protein J7373_04125 [Xanthomonas sp. A2111]|uniref:DUF202 domain-containing protein n=1 Tax=Xanthomonas hawaiiensis TaxID=3003247 RepID=A0ABU2I8M2_9XANT|nr:MULTISPECIES: hypothetical protein [unclassified Xanthomonas]MBO9827433.1 hypothetical protein [Xanthomonas sp. A2111]MBO9872537.1 hypothetical protein [Xanthomonas sp. D-93]MDS9994479.1 hypothetical protein [Xanthomonas sp. A2111]WNH46173.1 hypothetical protein PG878_06920 [Xanthomonas sp. A6251]
MNTIPIGNIPLIRSFLLLFFATGLASIGWQSTDDLDWKAALLYGGMVATYATGVIFYHRSLQKRRPFVNYGYSTFLLFLSLLALASGLITLLVRL